MKWEDILKISAGERNDAERFADPEDLSMDDAEMRKVILGNRKRLNFLMERPKKISETLKLGGNHLIDDFLRREAEIIMNMNLDSLDKRLKNIEKELNKDSPNMFKVKRMMDSYEKTVRDARKPLRELLQERDYRLMGKKPSRRK